jgi:hypothetical protein
MKIRHLLLPSGNTEGIPLLIDPHWSVEQAAAIIELLDDVREQIWRHYGAQLQAFCAEDRINDSAVRAPDRRYAAVGQT